MEQPAEAVAYHEAGHAVVALVLGRPVQRVTILAEGERLGTCEFGKAVFRPSEDWLEREALIALGGLAAEARWTGNYAMDGAAKDRQYVASLARQRTGEGRKRAQAAGVKFGRKPKLSDFQRREAIKRRAAGESLADIAKSYAVDISMISRLAPGFRTPFEVDAGAASTSHLSRR